MNLWTLIASILLTWSISTAGDYHLPIFTLESKDGIEQVLVTEKIVKNSIVSPHKINNDSLGVKLTAVSAAVMDKNSSIILWKKNAEEIRSIASISKLMTALIFLENNPGWDSEVTMLQEDETRGAINNISRGEIVKAEDLFYTSLIASDNNATKALARSTGISEKEFIDKMNKKAKELGLPNTKFFEVTGLDERNVSTAVDILNLAKEVFTKEEIKLATTKQNYQFTAVSGKAHKVYSTDHLLNSYLDIVAGKTGYINAAGYCLVAEVVGSEGNSIISVVLGSASNDDRFKDLKVLSAWVFENYSWY
jgi:D-alanyl-D-alanine endopeptidase (penicillin-binding protein 7)